MTSSRRKKKAKIAKPLTQIELDQFFADLDNEDGTLSNMSIDDVSNYDDISDGEIPTVVNAADKSDEEDDTTRTVD